MKLREESDLEIRIDDKSSDDFKFGKWKKSELNNESKPNTDKKIFN